MKNSILTLFLLHFVLFGFSQDRLTNELNYELNYEIYTNYPPLSISKETLKNAQTLTDLNRHYKTSWIQTYISMEISTIYKGNIRKAVSKNDMLSQEQKDIINMADVGKNIMVKLEYIPENNLKNNDIKVFDFKFVVNPESEATYVGGEEQLKKYLKNKAINKIPEDVFIGYDLAAVKFTINEEGQVTNPQIFESSKDEKTDELLLKTIADMPCWKPAEYANGIHTKQEFVLTVGNMENCIVHLLNIRSDEQQRK